MNKFKTNETDYNTGYDHIYEYDSLYTRNRKNRGMLKGKAIPISDKAVEYLKNTYSFSNSKEAQFGLRIIEFSDKYSIEEVIDAFNVSRFTIYRRWKILKESKGKLSSLIPKPKKPKRLRKMNIDPEIISFIREIREKHPGIGKEKIKPLPGKYCNETREGFLKTVSVSTIGRIIKRYNLSFNSFSLSSLSFSSITDYHNPNSKWTENRRNIRRIKKYKSHVKHSPNLNSTLNKQSGGYIEIDTIALFMPGIKRYIFNAVDISTRFQFSYAFKSKSSKNALEFFKKVERIYPLKNDIYTVQADNVSEYLKEFDKYLKEKQIKHLFIYP